MFLYYFSFLYRKTRTRGGGYITDTDGASCWNGQHTHGQHSYGQYTHMCSTHMGSAHMNSIHMVSTHTWTALDSTAWWVYSIGININFLFLTLGRESVENKNKIREREFFPTERPKRNFNFSVAWWPLKRTPSRATYTRYRLFRDP